jgi:beta-lactamase superfamily II metal-dependent hydrolase
MSRWELYITQIDVGQGESTLIVARDLATGRQRSMLVDAGLYGYGQIVHSYVSENIFNRGSLDHIVVSHYDKDHFGGIASLLTADNAYAIAQTIAAATAAAVTEIRQAGGNELFQASAGAAAAAAAAVGAYDVPDDPRRQNDFSEFAVLAGREGANKLDRGINDLSKAAEAGYKVGLAFAGKEEGRNPSILPVRGPLRKKVCLAASLAAVRGRMIDDLVELARKKIQTTFYDNITPMGGRFDTDGLYAKTDIIDPGQSRIRPRADYVAAFSGKVSISLNGTEAPLPLRKRSTPPLESELLWGKNEDDEPLAPPRAPRVLLVAANGKIAGSTKSIAFAEEGNDTSLGLIVKFNDFYFYTGGDLPSEGESLIWQYLHTKMEGPKPNHICCFKCGHHGASTSSSQTFIDGIKARAALISAGMNVTYKHPTQQTITNLQTSKTIQNFYLTNLQYTRTFAPWRNDLFTPGIKSRISGDNEQNNSSSTRRARGNIEVYVDEQSSLSTVHPGDPGADSQVNHGFVVTYYEDVSGQNLPRRHNH